jgi:hypothetical protein
MSEYEEDIEDEQLEQEFEEDDMDYEKGKRANKYQHPQKTPSDG